MIFNVHFVSLQRYEIALIEYQYIRNVYFIKKVYFLFFKI